MKHEKIIPELSIIKKIEYVLKLAQAENISDIESVNAISREIINLKDMQEFPSIISDLEQMKVGVESFDEVAKNRLDKGIDMALDEINKST